LERARVGTVRPLTGIERECGSITSCARSRASQVGLLALAAVGILFAWWFLHGERASASTLEHGARRDVVEASAASVPSSDASTESTTVRQSSSTSDPAPAPTSTSLAEVTPPPPAPIEVAPTPIEPAPVEPAPIEPAPIEPAPIEPAPIEPKPSPPPTGVVGDEPDPVQPSPTPSEPAPNVEPASPVATDPTTAVPCDAKPARAASDGTPQRLATSGCSDLASAALVVGLPNPEPPLVVRNGDDDEPGQSVLETDLRTPPTRAEPATWVSAPDTTTGPGPGTSGPPTPNQPPRTPRPQPEQPALLGATSAGATQLHQEIDRSVPAAMTSTPSVGTSTYQRLHLQAERFVTTELDDRTARPD
jgi:hypothetical protein